MIMIENWHTTAVDEAAMVELGAKLATVLMKGSVVYLTGELGAGKTTFTRGFLRYHASHVNAYFLHL